MPIVTTIAVTLLAAVVVIIVVVIDVVVAVIVFFVVSVVIVVIVVVFVVLVVVVIVIKVFKLHNIDVSAWKDSPVAGVITIVAVSPRIQLCCCHISISGGCYRNHCGPACCRCCYCHHHGSQ